MEFLSTEDEKEAVEVLRNMQQLFAEDKRSPDQPSSSDSLLSWRSVPPASSNIGENLQFDLNLPIPETPLSFFPRQSDSTSMPSQTIPLKNMLNHCHECKIEATRFSCQDQPVTQNYLLQQQLQRPLPSAVHCNQNYIIPDLNMLPVLEEEENETTPNSK